MQRTKNRKKKGAPSKPNNRHGAKSSNRHSAKPSDRRGAKADPYTMIVGRHPVAEELGAARSRALKLYVEENDSADLARLAKLKNVDVEYCPGHRLHEMAGQGLVHQGAVLQCAPYVFAELDAVKESESKLLVALDGIEDPRNLGAIARTAFAFGAGALIVPAKNSAGPTASAHKTAAGALSHIPMVRAENLRRCLERLQKEGYWVVGAEADGNERPAQVDFTVPTVLVIGGEDRGLRRLTREVCDHVTAIPMTAQDFSLNASTAASILLYEVSRQRHAKPFR